MAKETGKLPKALEDRPTLNAGTIQYAEAFTILNGFRNMNGDLNFSDIVLYAELIGEKDVLGFVTLMSFANSALKKFQEENKEIVKSK